MVTVAEPPSILPLHVGDLMLSIEGRMLLRDISFDVRKGTMTIVLGPNGAGKSLLLRLCHGLLQPTAGQVSWAGPERAGGRKRHAMVFQKPIMLRRSVMANMTHALAATGLGRRAREEKALNTLEQFSLEAFADRPARLLSGGEQQRLAIARAWALEPEVLFLDEPTSQLDPNAVREIEDMLAQLKAEGCTLVMSTHDIGQARRLADRVLFLAHGCLVEDAAAADFFTGRGDPRSKAFLAGDLVLQAE
jgi:tungstate transport system ATP-binding protein